MDAHRQVLENKRPGASVVMLSSWTYLALTVEAEEVMGLGVVIVPRIWPEDTFDPSRAGAGAGRLRNLSLSVGEGAVSICDPAEGLKLSDAQARALCTQSGRWSSSVSVHALTAGTIKTEIARARAGIAEG
jgi:hypothetical protein